jgi:acetoacetyl-CoA synthetase
MIGDILWEPPADLRQSTEVGRFMEWLRDRRALEFEGYDELQRWSTGDLEGFDLGVLRGAGARGVRGRPGLP